MKKKKSTFLETVLFLLVLASVFLITKAKTTTTTHEFRLGCFNVENLGPAKGGRPAVMEVLAQVVRRYDVLFIQELSDKPPAGGVCGPDTGRVVCDLLARAGVARRLAVSARLTATGSGAEQYALLYDPAQFALEAAWVVNDSATGAPAYATYMRPPMVARLRSRRTGALLAAGVCHTRPRTAAAEVVALAHELAALEAHVAPHAVLCGDFNAQFGAATWRRYYDALPGNGSAYGMEIANGVATGVLSGATLDRVVTTPALHARVAAARAFWFNDTARGGFSLAPVVEEGCGAYLRDRCTTQAATEAISDHFPVEVDIQLVGSSASRASIPSLLFLFFLLSFILFVFVTPSLVY